MRASHLEVGPIGAFTDVAASSVRLSQVLDHGTTAHHVQKLATPTDPGHGNLVLLSHLEDHHFLLVSGIVVVAGQILVPI